MRSRFLSAAEEEFGDAAAFYEGEEFSLGEEFIAGVFATVDLLQRQPMLGKPAGGRFRSFPVRKFPFNIIYKLDEDEIVVVAVGHQSRKPGYWRDRIFSD